MKSRELGAGESVTAEGTIIYEQYRKQTGMYAIILALGICFCILEKTRIWGGLLVLVSLALIFLYKDKKMTTITDQCILTYPAHSDEMPILLYVDEIVKWAIKTGTDGAVLCYFVLTDGTMASVDVVQKVKFHQALRKLMPDKEEIPWRRKKK